MVILPGDIVHIDGALGAGVDVRLGYGPVSGSANFGNTAWISGLDVLESNHQVTTALSVVSESGVDYTSITETAAVPEPSSAVHFAGACFLIGASRALRFRRRY